MSDSRRQRLLQKELDGELSQIERDELERLVVLDPEARRTCAFWRTLEKDLHDEFDTPREFDLARLAGGIVEAVSERTRSRRTALAVSLATALAIMVAAPVSWLMRHAVTPPEPVIVAEGFTEPPPVHVRIARDYELETRAPVSIRF